MDIKGKATILSALLVTVYLIWNLIQSEFAARSLPTFYKLRGFPSRGNESKEIQQFWYIRPMKTASTITMHELLQYCIDNHLNCPTKSYKQACVRYSKLFRSSFVNKQNYPVEWSGISPWSVCAIQEKQLSHQLQTIDHFYITALRLKTCCNDTWPVKPSLFHHVYLGDLQTKQFMFSLMKDAFKFTMIRNPVDQFVSYFSFMERQPMNFTYSTYLDNIGKFVLKDFVDGCLDGNASLKHACALASNMQSRMLGWDGQNESEIEAFLNSLDLVCLSEYVVECWKSLKHKLNWDDRYFNTRKLHKPSNYFVIPGLKEKIRRVQVHDIELYKHAKHVYKRKFTP